MGTVEPVRTVLVEGVTLTSQDPETQGYLDELCELIYPLGAGRVLRQLVEMNYALGWDGTRRFTGSKIIGDGGAEDGEGWQT